jgi:hypothetical protein
MFVVFAVICCVDMFSDAGASPYITARQTTIKMRLVNIRVA